MVKACSIYEDNEDTLWEKHRLRVLENPALGRIFGPKMEEMS
jgi:hypothetical protein